jgi:hypothetical protein
MEFSKMFVELRKMTLNTGLRRRELENGTTIEMVQQTGDQ